MNGCKNDVMISQQTVTDENGNVYTIRATAKTSLVMRTGTSSALTKIIPEQIVTDQNCKVGIIDIDSYEQ